MGRIPISGGPEMGGEESLSALLEPDPQDAGTTLDRSGRQIGPKPFTRISRGEPADQRLDRAGRGRLVVRAVPDPAAEQAAKARKPEHTAELKAAFAGMEQAADARAYFRANVAFTDAVHEAAGNPTLRRLLSGLRLVSLSSWNQTMFLPALGYALLWRACGRRWEPRNNLERVPGLLDRPLRWLLRAEQRLAEVVPAPLGVSLVAVVQKPG